MTIPRKLRAYFWCVWWGTWRSMLVYWGIFGILLGIGEAIDLAGITDRQESVIFMAVFSAFLTHSYYMLKEHWFFLLLMWGGIGYIRYIAVVLPETHQKEFFREARKNMRGGGSRPPRGSKKPRGRRKQKDRKK